jgi:PTH1 family peptidyl-tRNA hydrolase
LTKSTGIQLIAGLGNPGTRYELTRHNAGFWFVDELTRRFGGVFRSDAKILGQVCRICIDDQDLWLLKPATLMNRSGQSLNAMINYFKIHPLRILVVHDDIDLQPGVARLKRTGGHGGHNGLRDIIAHMGKTFWRLRLGVGHPGDRDQVIDYVLSRPSRHDQGLIQECILRAADLMDHIIMGEMERAMHQLHSKADM